MAPIKKYHVLSQIVGRLGGRPPIGSTHYSTPIIPRTQSASAVPQAHVENPAGCK